MMIVSLANLFVQGKKKSSNQNLFEVTVPMKRIKEDAAFKKVRHHKFYVWIILLLSEKYYWKLP